MVVLEPLKIIIENFPTDHKEVTVPNFPSKPELGFHKVNFEKVIYIEKSDFMENADKGYRRLTTTQSVGLRHAGYVIDVTKINKDSNGTIVELICKCTDVDKIKTKPKAFIHWVSKPTTIEVRVYDMLFKHKNPEDPNEVPGGFLTDCNKNSLKVYESYADEYLKTAKVYDKFQFERNGYFSVDPDTTSSKVSKSVLKKTKITS